MNKVPVLFAAFMFFSFGYFAVRYKKFKGKNSERPLVAKNLITFSGIVFILLGLFCLGVAFK